MVRPNQFQQTVNLRCWCFVESVYSKNHLSSLEQSFQIGFCLRIQWTAAFIDNIEGNATERLRQVCKYFCYPWRKEIECIHRFLCEVRIWNRCCTRLQQSCLNLPEETDRLSESGIPQDHRTI